jgi:hypothetical protein
MKAIAVFLLTLLVVLSIGGLFYWLASILHMWLLILEKGLQTL